MPRKHGFKVSSQVDFFKGFQSKIPKIALSFKELEQIQSTELKEKKHQIARDWLIVGCYTGQRSSDLFKMQKSMIEVFEGYRFIVLDQQKTGKRVQIPLHSKVEEILKKYKGNFPPLYYDNIESHKMMFNKTIKQVCKLSSIDDKTEGSHYDKKKKRQVIGLTEKYNLISSHTCRRSFATSFYSERKYPTLLLMNITAHSTEQMFLEYIGKKPLDYGLQLAKIWSEKV